MHKPFNCRQTQLAVLLFALSASPVFAADTMPDSTTSSVDSLSTARNLITAKKWQDAIGELRRVNESRNADWNNLMGYSLRKASTPDLEAAERHYSEALRINPKHLGALEYSGELYLMKGNLAKAEQRLAALDKVCSKQCEEQADLQKAIQAFKANGNRYMQAQ